MNGMIKGFIVQRISTRNKRERLYVVTSQDEHIAIGFRLKEGPMYYMTVDQFAALSQFVLETQRR